MPCSYDLIIISLDLSFNQLIKGLSYSSLVFSPDNKIYLNDHLLKIRIISTFNLSLKQLQLQFVCFMVFLVVCVLLILIVLFVIYVHYLKLCTPTLSQSFHNCVDKVLFTTFHYFLSTADFLLQKS